MNTRIEMSLYVTIDRQDYDLWMTFIGTRKWSWATLRIY